MRSVGNSPVNATAKLSIHYKLLIAAFVLAVVLFNRQGGFLLAVPKLLALIVVFSFMINLIAQGRKIYVPVTYLIWVIWFFVAVLSTLLADDVRLAGIITLSQLAFLGFVITQFLIWNGDTRFYVLALIAGAAASSFWILADPQSFLVRGRISGTIGNANAHGVLLSTGMISSFVLALTSKAWKVKIPLFMLAGLFFLQILQTGSRQALIGGVGIGGVSVMAAYLYRNWCAGNGSFGKSLLWVSAIIPALVIVLVTSEFWFRMERAFDTVGDGPGADGSVDGRLWMIDRGLEIWADHPMLGIGLGNYRFSAEADHLFSRAIGTYAHNNYIEILVGTGLIGLLIYVSIYGLLVFKAFALRWALKDESTFAPYTMVFSVTLMVIATDFTRVSHNEKLFWLLLPWIVAELHLLDNKKHAAAFRGLSPRDVIFKK